MRIFDKNMKKNENCSFSNSRMVFRTSFFFFEEEGNLLIFLFFSFNSVKI